MFELFEKQDRDVDMLLVAGKIMFYQSMQSAVPLLPKHDRELFAISNMKEYIPFIEKEFSNSIEVQQIIERFQKLLHRSKKYKQHLEDITKYIESNDGELKPLEEAVVEPKDTLELSD